MGFGGYWTDGVHWDPLLDRFRRASATNPVPYAGGAVPIADAPTTFTHNSYRPVGNTLADGPIPSRQHPPGSLLLAIEEAFFPDVREQGPLGDTAPARSR